jgi:PAS domain S-box-containing protein
MSVPTTPSLSDSAAAPASIGRRDPGTLRALTRYLLAVLAVVLAAAAAILLWPLIKSAATPLFFTAVAVSAWAGGFGPGLLATALSALALEFFFMASVTARGPWYETMLRIEVFMVAALLVSALNASRRRSEATATRARLFLQATLDSLSARIAIIDGRGAIVAANDAWRRGGGPHPAGDVVGTNYLERWAGRAAVMPEAPAVGTGIREVLENRRREFAAEYASREGDEVRWFSIHATRLEIPGPAHVVVAKEDITERTRAAEAERRAASLRSAARLASAAAHEINNPLAIIMGNVEIIAAHVDKDGTARIRPVLDAIYRIREIVARMTRITDLRLYEQSPSLPEMLDIRRSSATLEVHGLER